MSDPLGPVIGGVSVWVSAVLLAITFTPENITALTIAIGALIAIIFTGIVNVMTVWQAKKVVVAAAQETKVQLLEMSAVGKVIEGHVNSAATASTALIESLRNELAVERRISADNKEIAARLAQDTAQAAVVRAGLVAVDKPVTS